MIKSRKNRYAISFLSDAAGGIIVTIANFVSTPYVLRSVGAEYYGYWIVILSIMNYLCLLDFGIAFSMVKGISGNLHDEERIYRYINTGIIVLVTVSLAYLILGFGIALIIYNTHYFNGFKDPKVWHSYAIALASGSFGLIGGIWSSILIGCQRQYIDNLSKTILGVVSIVISVILIGYGFSITGIAMSMLFNAVAVLFLGYWLVKQTEPVKNVGLNKLSIHRPTFNEMLRFGWKFQAGRVANTISLCSDSIIIGIMIGPETVAIYALSGKLPGFILTNVISKIGGSLFPFLSEMQGSNNKIKIIEILKKTSVISIRCGIISALIVWLCNLDFITLWVGRNHYIGSEVNFILSFVIITDSVNRLLGSFIFSMGDLRGWVICCIVEATMSVFFSVLFTNYLGIVGLPLGILLAKLASTGWYVPIKICKNLEYPISNFLYNDIMVSFIKCIPTMICAWIIYQSLDQINSIVRMAIVVVSTILINIASFEGLSKLLNIKVIK